MSIPVLKLPPDKVEPSVKAILTARKELREEVVTAIRRDVYPDYASYPDFEKRIFRALIAPVLTRLHLARSEPPYFRPAPNARLWGAIGSESKAAYLSAVLFDFALVKLQLEESLIAPKGSLREMARKYGKELVDRVRGLDAMLRFFAAEEMSTRGGVEFLTCHQVIATPDITELIKRTLPKGRILGIDEARYLIMKGLLAQNKLATSFAIDEVLKTAARQAHVTLLKSSYARIDSLLVGGIAFGAVSVS